MTAPVGHNSDNALEISQREFASFIDRILRCREAEDAAKDDTKAVYAGMHSAGYDKAAAGAFVMELRKQDKNADKFAERNAILDLYRTAYEAAKQGRTGTPVRARENIEEFPVSEQPQTGESDAKSAAVSAEYPDNLIGAGNNREEPAHDETVRIGRHIDASPAPRNGSVNDAPAGSAEQIPDPLPEPFEPPAFLSRERKPLRPHCLQPDMCRSGTRDHCRPCEQAAEASST